MNALDCPYLLRETLTFRESLDLSKNAPMRVVVSWQCSHPFHGLRLELGEEPGEVRRRCAGCALPHAGAPASTGEAETQQRPDDFARQDDLKDRDAV